MIVFLYGAPGSGKTTVGRLLAQALDFEFIDLDERIEAQAGMRIPELFATEGETGFRGREAAALRQVAALSPPTSLPKGVGKHQGRVIALGGGALLDNENRRLAESAGQVVFLEVGYETLLKRVSRTAGSKRPLLAGEAGQRLSALLEKRKEHYASFPLRLRSAGRSAEQTAWQAQVLLGAFRVQGMDAAYDLRIANGLLNEIGLRLRALGLGGPICLVSDETVGRLYAPRVLASLQSAGYPARLVSLSPGEEYKNLQSVARLWEAFLETGLERGSTVVALGGGVIGDLAGFAAATYLRGIRWVGLPMTLLAMVDASLGGKTGADLPQGKNLVGAFHPPSLVLTDPSTLDTLPQDELRSGLAEVVKHGVIADPELFALCACGWEALQARREELVSRAAAVKIQVIQEDPYEHGRRAALNLGHTLGHAVEKASDYRLKHGYAVAIGMVAAARLAEWMSIAERGLAVQIAEVLAGLGLPTEIPPEMDRERIRRAMLFDKKKASGRLRFVLPERIGAVRVGVELGEEELERMLG